MNKKDLQPYIEEFSGDVYVGDYTEYSKMHPEHEGEGVCFSEEPFPDLNSLHIVNRNGIHVGALNFEKCGRLFRNEAGQKAVQCEGLCFAIRAKSKGWTLLIELKYCMDKNIGGNVDNAKYQLQKSLELLRAKGIVEKSDRVYWVLSIPDHSELEPFSSFIYSENDLLELQEKLGVVSFFRQNTVEILTATHLRIPAAGTH